MSVLELRLKKDLLGLPYIQLDDVPSTKKSIATTRSFKTTWRILKLKNESLHMQPAAENCANKSSCTALMVFVRSNPHKDTSEPYRNSCVVTLPYATDSGITLTKYAILGLKRFLKKG